MDPRVKAWRRPAERRQRSILLTEKGLSVLKAISPDERAYLRRLNANHTPPVEGSPQPSVVI